MSKLNYIGEIIVDSVWVREIPSLSGKPIKILYKNARVKLTDQNDNWFKCDIGWICSKLDNGTRLMKISNVNSTREDKPSTEKPVEEDEENKVNHEYINDYINEGNVDASQAAAAFLKSVRGIHGLPYQFLPNTDRRLPGSNFGRKYSEKIIAKMPLLLLTPGVPRFMATYSNKDKTNLLSYLTGKGNKDDGILDKIVNNGKDGNSKFYSFEFAYKQYYACVNPMLQRIARFLDIQDMKIDGTVLDRYKWENYTNEAFKGFVSSRESVAFYVDSETQISESFSNSTSQSMLAQSVNGLSEMGKEMQFLLGGVAGVEFDALKEENRGEVLADFNAFADKFARVIPKNLMNKVSNGFLTVASGGKMIFPEIWQDSKFSRSYSISIKLRSPESDNFSLFMNILVPLVHLICLAAPRQMGANSYQAPFLVRGFYKGFFNCEMGIIESLNIRKGDKGKWSSSGLPTVVDVEISLKDLYDVMTITQDDNVLDLLNNTALLDYLANMCGININKPDVLRSLDIYYTQLTNKVINTVTFKGFLGVEQALTNLVGSIFKR